jgi:methyl-accepting chemotaxis protein
MAYALVNAVRGPIHRLSQALKSFASGEADLTAKIDESGDDELAEMAKDFNTFVGKTPHAGR